MTFGIAKKLSVADNGRMTAPTGERQLTGAIPADTFANRLMLVRSHAGYITVREAAERCGLNYGSWSNWERGKLPRDLIDVAEKVSEGLGIDRNWLLLGGELANPRRRRQATREYRGMTVRPGQGADRPATKRPSGGPRGAMVATSIRRPARVPR